MSRIRNDKSIENEIFDLLKFSDAQRKEARGTIGFNDTPVFVANKPASDSDVIGAILNSVTLH